MIVAFPGNQFQGEIAPAIADLVDAGTIRIIDIAFVGKDEDGDALALELTELDPEVQKGLESLASRSSGLFNEDDLMDAATASSRTRRPRFSCGRTSGRARPRRQCGTRVGSCSRSSGCRTRSYRQPATGRSRPQERRAE